MGPIGPCPTLAGEDEDPDVLATADMTDAPAVHSWLLFSGVSSASPF